MHNFHCSIQPEYLYAYVCEQATVFLLTMLMFMWFASFLHQVSINKLLGFHHVLQMGFLSADMCIVTARSEEGTGKHIHEAKHCRMLGLQQRPIMIAMLLFVRDRTKHGNKLANKRSFLSCNLGI